MAEERRFPIQGGLTVTWCAAERAYESYSSQFGMSQSLERLAERGGFGVQEFAWLYSGRGRLRDLKDGELARALRDGDIRATPRTNPPLTDDRAHRLALQLLAVRPLLRELRAQLVRQRLECIDCHVEAPCNCGVVDKERRIAAALNEETNP